MTIKGLDGAANSAAAAHKPAHFQLEHLIRPNILSLEPYRCARDDYQSGILLDANENSLGHSLPPKSVIPHNPGTTNGGATPVQPAEADDVLSLNRYPDPGLFGIKDSLAALRGVPNDAFVFLGVGSDEVLDLVQRVCCRPGKDKILICPPTYGMYSVCAAVNDLEVVKVPLITEGGKFSLDVEAVNRKLSEDPDIKITFICSPGNPTGTLIPPGDVKKVLDNESYKGLVVVDEAYIDFAEEEKRMGKRPADEVVSAVSLVHEYQNVMVTQTLSKAFGLAAIRYVAPRPNPSNPHFCSIKDEPSLTSTFNPSHGALFVTQPRYRLCATVASSDHEQHQSTVQHFDAHCPPRFAGSLPHRHCSDAPKRADPDPQP